jgi:hypothetical protein
MVSDGLNATLVVVESVPTEVEIENKLHSEILSLWVTHQVGKAVARKSNEELRTLRLDLGKKLYEMKSILARNGRGGGWTPYLRANGFARATADRLAHMHETSLEPETKCLAEAIPETTAEDVRRLVRSLLPRLRKVLTTPSWVEWFLVEIAFQLNTADASLTSGVDADPAAKDDSAYLGKVEVAPLTQAA